ncbi:hypothetical protein L2E82_02546 [Cichorium intybus]|uniref:Uncharacterized protein n=1 Tax=Cichorium intybus TaxID=13427 RepID=A0ACB9H1N1_CICIN|nr:hypothetical protein L2E82_02546 [Cichorium intybus]
MVVGEDLGFQIHTASLILNIPILHYSSPLHKRAASEVEGQFIRALCDSWLLGDYRHTPVTNLEISGSLRFTTNPQRFIKEFKSKISDAFDRYSFNNRRDLRYRLGDGLV